MTKKKTKWQRNYESVVRAQNRAKSIIAELSIQGQHVSKYLMELVNKPLKTTRYSTKEARNYINLLRSDVIRANAKREAKRKVKANVQENYYSTTPYQKYQLIKNRVRFKEKIAYSPDTMYEDIAKAYFEHIKYSITKPSQDLARNLWRTFKTLNIKGKNKLKIAEMDKFLEGIQEEDFINSYASIMKGTDTMRKNNLKALQNAFYGMGRSSSEAFEAAKEIQFEQAKITFGKNHGWYKEDVDKLYNFFKNSKAWKDYQKIYKDSEQLEELFDEINDTGLSIEQIDRILMGHNNVDNVLKEMERK